MGGDQNTNGIRDQVERWADNKALRAIGQIGMVLVAPIFVASMIWLAGTLLQIYGKMERTDVSIETMVKAVETLTKEQYRATDAERDRAYREQRDRVQDAQINTALDSIRENRGRIRDLEITGNPARRGGLDWPKAQGAPAPQGGPR